MIVEAAAWMHARRERLRGSRRRAVENCPACAGRTGNAECRSCGGAGIIQREQDDDEAVPAAAAHCAELIEAHVTIERFGLDGWMRLAGLEAADLHPALGRALLMLASELDRLEMDDMERRHDHKATHRPDPRR